MKLNSRSPRTSRSIPNLPRRICCSAERSTNRSSRSVAACWEFRSRNHSRAKKLHVPIGKTFKLSEASQAHKFLEENTLGKAGTLVGKVIVEI